MTHIQYAVRARHGLPGGTIGHADRRKYRNSAGRDPLQFRYFEACNREYKLMPRLGSRQTPSFPHPSPYRGTVQTLRVPDAAHVAPFATSIGQQAIHASTSHIRASYTPLP
ncbi:hypothetical protein LIA77_00530 [Sarocladium implicatum]|nr:hypothetical protein LIA77_00530 [Sarocladium implicatum]